jgi:tetratricopeptide (TPR) repeat protein
MKAEATSKQAQVEAARTRLELLRGFLREDPDNSTLLGDAFIVALKCGDWEGAQALLTHAQGRHPGDPAWALREGDFWLAQHRYDAARIVLQRLALLAEPASPLANVVAQNLAHVDFCQLDYAACIARLEPLMRVPPELGGDFPIGATQQLWLRALHRHKDLARACQWASEADRAGQLAPGAAGVASLAAIDHEDFEAAQRWINLAHTGNEAPTLELLVAQASLALAARDSDAARRFAAQALAINPEDGRAWSVCGFAELLGGNLETAGQGFERALFLMPQHIGTWHGQGWTQVLRRNLPAAQASFESALALDRNFAENHGGLAVVLAIGQQAEAAREHIEVAQRLDRGNLSSRYAEAILGGEVQDWKAVRRLAERLLGGRKAPLGGQMGWLPADEDRAS